MRRWTLLLAGAALWLFLAALPAMADGGPHTAEANSGVSTLTTDSCAGCHRAHTAQGQYIITAPDEETLCLSCHGEHGSGATTDVVTGVQYASGADHSAGTNQIGALRAGGFVQARLGVPARIATTKGGGLSGKVTVGDAVNVTSAHLVLPDVTGLNNQHIAWGNGANGSDAGPTVELGCTSCHNPHGNQQYRILNTLPALTPTSGTFTDAVTLKIKSADAVADTFTTYVGNPFSIGDIVTISGITNFKTGDYTVVSALSGIQFQVGTFASGGITVVDITSGTVWTSSATVKRTKAPVADSPIGTFDVTSGTYPTKNYTVNQAKGDQGAGTGYLFYASQVTGIYSATTGDYFHKTVPWQGSSTADDAPNGQPYTLVSGTAAGEIAFTVQMTAWCSSCHSRYLAIQNPNPTGSASGSSDPSPFTINAIDSSTGTVTVKPGGRSGTSGHGFLVGDTVTFAGSGANNGDRVVLSVPLTPFVAPSVSDAFGAPLSFTVAGLTVDTTGGTVVRQKAPQTASAWFFPRALESTAGTDAIFKYQHRTVPNRTCTTCHVAHGSNVAMDGAYSSQVAYPNGVVKASSRLLKVANRGTCTFCHDPSSTIPAKTYSGPAPTPEPAASPWPGNSFMVP